MNKYAELRIELGIRFFARFASTYPASRWLPCYYLIIDPSFCEIGVCSGGAEMRIPQSVNGTQRLKYLHEKKVALPNIVTWQVVLERRRFCQATLVVVMGEFQGGGRGGSK